MRPAGVLALGVVLAAGCMPKSQYAELESSYTAAVADRDRALAETARVQAALEDVRARHRKRLEAFSAVYADLLEVQSAGLAKVRIEDGRAVLQLDSDVLFPSGSAQLTEVGQQAIRDIAKVLAATPAAFQVEGHTDADPINSREFPSNWHLGADRAINVVLALIAAGMPATQVSAASYGLHAPVVANDTPENKKLNRRIELVWMPEVSDVLPYARMLEELQQRDTATAE